MSWKFAAILFQKDYASSYDALLGRLGVERSGPVGEVSFADAVSRRNLATALGAVQGKTLLLDPLLPYDCSYEAGGEGPLDERLRSLSFGGDILNFIFDGVSATYCFTLFRQAKRVRRWAAEAGEVWCDDGPPIAGEGEPTSLNAATALDLSAMFAPSADETRLLAVWEAFLGTSFQDLVRDERPSFQVFE